jgi:excinuclease ABC subunit C
MPDLSSRPQLAQALANLPEKAGVYLFRDARARLLYVGKAESLRDRVRSYFHDEAQLTPKIQRVVEQATGLEYILTDSPVQALIWENDLVRKEQPRYNTKLRDDKHYPYIRINVQDPWPVARVTRRMARDGARYFGPFPHATSVRQTLDTLSRLFPHILCNRTITGTDPRACLYLHIKRCPAPCIGLIDNHEYRKIVDEMIRFLEGKNRTVMQDLRHQMEQAAENLEFERAADLRDRLKAAERVIEQEKLGYATLTDQDIIGLARDGAQACLQVFFIRGGQLARRDPYIMVNAEDESDRDLVTAFVKQFYSQASEIPEELVLTEEPDEAEAIRAWLRQTRGRAVRLTVAQRGEKRRMVELASKNAAEALERMKTEWLADQEKTSEALWELQEYLQLANTPRRIECYDISNTQGTNSVASMVVFEDGRSKRSEYRRFKIKTVEGPNDFASHQEVLRRRFKRAMAGVGAPAPVIESDDALELDTAEQLDSIETDGESPNAQQPTANTQAAPPTSWAQIPDLVIIDGGKGQLSAALEVMEDLELTEIPVVGLAKENEEIFVKGRAAPILLPRTSQSLYLVQRIRDEAHRFAITYHRKLRGKSSVRSALDDVPGIGPTRKRALLRQFGSLKAIREADVDALAAVPGMTRTSAASLKASL